MRILNLDFWRGMAVVWMVNEHLLSWLWQGPSYEGFWGLAVVYTLAALGGLAAPMFLALSAHAQALAVHRGALQVKRGLLLMVLAMGLNWAVPVWFSPLSWYVLHLLALVLILFPLWQRLSIPMLWGLGALILVVAPWLRGPVQGHWSNVQMNGWDLWVHGSLAQVWELILWSGFFPVFPWLGFWLCSLAHARMGGSGAWQRCLGLGALGACLWLLGAMGVVQPWALWTETRSVFYPLSLPLALMLWALIHTLLALPLGPGLWPKIYGALVDLGRMSLSLFLVHIVLFRNGLPVLELYRSCTAWTSVGLTWTLLALVLIFRKRLAPLAWAEKWLRLGESKL